MSFLTIPVLAQARHGKDTIANALLDDTGRSYCRVALADEVKIDCMNHYGKRFPFFNVTFDKKGRISYPNDTTNPEELAFRRIVWQVWGTEGRRDIFPDIWLWRWAPRAWKFMSTGDFEGVVVPDIRFFNEAEFFKVRGSHILGAQRFNKDGTLYKEPGIDYEHRSERDIPKILLKMADLVIRNDKTYEDYQQRVHDMLTVEGYL